MKNFSDKLLFLTISFRFYNWIFALLDLNSKYFCLKLQKGILLTRAIFLHHLKQEWTYSFCKGKETAFSYMYHSRRYFLALDHILSSFGCCGRTCLDCMPWYVTIERRSLELIQLTFYKWNVLGLCAWDLVSGSQKGSTTLLWK